MLKNCKFKGPLRRRVASSRNSICGSAALSDLDWTNWWTDGTAGSVYLHVRRLHPTLDGTNLGDATWHRVHCRLTDKPRLAVVAGRLYWLVDRPGRGV